MGAEQFQVSLRAAGGDATVVARACGTGPTVLFVHGWSCCAGHFVPVADALADSFRVIGIDLPHHGGSTSTKNDWVIRDFGALVADFVRQQGLTDIVLVGHSMGSAVCVDAARLLGSTVRKVIALDGLTYLGIYPRQDDTVVAEAMSPFRTDFHDAIRGFVDFFMPDADESLRQQVYDGMVAGPQGPLLHSLESLLAWDMDASLAACSTPITVLAAQSFLDPDAVVRYGQRLDIRPVDLGGHFFFVEQPGPAAALLRPLLG